MTRFRTMLVAGSMALVLTFGGCFGLGDGDDDSCQAAAAVGINECD